MRGGLVSLAATAVVACCATAAAAPPPVAAPAYLVRGGPDSAVLAVRAPDAKRAPASITKLMTVLVALERARLGDVVTVTPLAAGVGESSARLRVGEQLTVRDLAIATLVPSANDAAVALAVHVGGGSVPRFVAFMNAKARSLGLTSTHFENPHGLDQAGHVSSARDVTTLLSAALRNPFIRTWSTQSDGDHRRRQDADVDGRADREAAARRREDGAHRTMQAGRRWRRPSVTASASRHRCSGSPSEAQRDADLTALLTWGLAQYQRREGGRHPGLRARRDGLRQTAGRARGAGGDRSQRAGRAGRSSSASSSARPWRSLSPAASGSER